MEKVICVYTRLRLFLKERWWLEMIDRIGDGKAGTIGSAVLALRLVKFGER